VTFYKQLLLVIVVLFLLMFAGTLVVNFQSTRIFLADQLASHAQDTATSLGLSLAPYTLDEDLPTMTSMVDAVFDRGYYKEVMVTSTDGKPLITRNLEIRIEGVPAWFVSQVTLDAPRANALLTSGWKQAGAVYVQSHPGYAYQELWNTTTRMFYWFAGTAALCALFGGLILRVLFRPLKAVERQAEAVCQRDYQIQTRVPKTRELRSVVIAMNRMTAKVKEMFKEQSRTAEELRDFAYRDSLTGLGNRRYFEAQLQTHLKSNQESDGGALLLVQLRNLSAINDRRGFEAGDRLLEAAGAILTRAASEYEGCVVARIGGADFGLLVPDVGPQDAESLAASVCDGLAGLHNQQFTDATDVGHAGVGMYVVGQDMAELFSEADLALRAAQTKDINTWHRHQDRESPGPEIFGRRQWQTHVAEVVSQSKVILHTQPVVKAHEASHIIHNEVLVRIPDQNNELLSAGIFMPMVEEQLEIARELDRSVLNTVMEYLNQVENAAPIAINLSLASLQDSEFVDWMFGALKRIPGSASRIQFEVPEFWAVRELQQVRDFAARLREHGFGFGLDHFGRGFSAFGYLQSLRPDYVKIDGAYTKNIFEDHDNQFFIRTLCSVAHSLDIMAIAEAVEYHEQWEMLKSLNVDGIQGYVVSRPGPMEF